MLFQANASGHFGMPEGISSPIQAPIQEQNPYGYSQTSQRFYAPNIETPHLPSERENKPDQTSSQNSQN